ncbi:hypothetical protein ACFLU6_00455 [Acidobacteriota bacterium]
MRKPMPVIFMSLILCCISCSKNEKPPSQLALEEAQQALADGDLNRAEQKANRALKSEKTSASASTILREVESRRDVSRPKLKEARAAVEEGNIENAELLVNEVLADDTSDESALNLLEYIQNQKAEAQQTLEKARMAMDRADLETAEKLARQVKNTDSSIESASSILDEIQKRRLSSKGVFKQARKSMEQGDLETARMFALNAVSRDGSNASITAFLDEIESRRQKSSKMTAHARKSMESGELDQARAQAEEALSINRGNIDAIGVLREIVTHKRRHGRRTDMAHYTSREEKPPVTRDPIREVIPERTPAPDIEVPPESPEQAAQVPAVEPKATAPLSPQPGEIETEAFRVISRARDRALQGEAVKAAAILDDYLAKPAADDEEFLPHARIVSGIYYNASIELVMNKDCEKALIYSQKASDYCKSDCWAHVKPWVDFFSGFYQKHRECKDYNLRARASIFKNRYPAPLQ